MKKNLEKIKPHLKKHKKKWLIFGGIVLLLLVGGWIYATIFQNVPQMAMPLMADFNLPKAGSKILIFSPHNDDEVLGAGGLIAEAEKKGIDVTVVFATNGDGHRLSSMETFKKLYPTQADYIQSGYDRQNESKNALETLGVSEQNIIFLGYPDGGLSNLLNANWSSPFTSPHTGKNFSPYTNSFHQNVSYTGQNLKADILSVLNQQKPDMVFVTSPADINHDHAALAQFVNKSLAQYQGQKPQVFYYLIHFNHFPSPKGLRANDYLAPPIRLVQTGGTWQKFMLNSDIINLKIKAVNCYRSQLNATPFLKSLMQGMIKKNELFQKGN